MSFLDTLGSAIGAAVSPQISAAETEAETIAQAVAVWGVIVAVELGIIIFILRRKS
jgi:hypothetical protein